MDRDFMKELLLAPGVSGSEEIVQRKCLAFGKQFADQQVTTYAGSAISIVNPEADFKVLLMGHADEIGFMVTGATASGLIRVQQAGGVRPILYVGTNMQIIHEGKKIPAVVAIEKSTLKKGSEAADKDLLLDIGASSKEEAEKYVSVGDQVCQDMTEVRELLNDNFTCKALDDRTGAIVVLEAAKRAKLRGSKIGIYCATTSGEETNGTGAFSATGFSKPNCAIAVDVTWANDCPGTDPLDAGKVSLGEGAVICVSGMVNKRMNMLLKKCAEENNIPLQIEVAGGRTFTDGDTTSKALDGVPMALVSVPLRYMHSSVEVGNWRDLEACTELLAQFLTAIDESFDFSPLSEKEI